VNAIAIFIWVGFVNDNPSKKKYCTSTRQGLRSASAPTKFPYGCGATLDIDLDNIAHSFSSYSSDNHHASSWRNLVLVLPQNMTIDASQKIEVNTVAKIGRVRRGEASPEYQFTIKYAGSTDVAATFELNMDSLYPTFKN